MSAMAQAATAAPAASLAARRAVGGKAVRAAAAPVRPVRAARGAPLKCDAIFDQLKSGFDGLLKGDPGEKTRVRYQARLDAINAMGPAMSKLSDDDLRAKTAELQQNVRGGADLDSILVEAFAVVREASDRVLGLRPFDVQLMGGGSRPPTLAPPLPTPTGII